MKDTIKNISYAILSIVIILPAIYLVTDYIYFQEPLSRVALYPDDPICDLDCTQQISEGYKCVEIHQDEYVCRQPRGYSIGDNPIRYHSAGPISYGEIVSFPEDKFEVSWFNISNVKIIDKNSNAIQVDFVESRDSPANVIYSAKLNPGDSFLSCINPWKGTHLVYYTDLYEYENKTYAEFWGLHPYTPTELFPCDVPKILEYSLRQDYNISLPEYDKFGFE